MSDGLTWPSLTLPARQECASPLAPTSTCGNSFAPFWQPSRRPCTGLPSIDRDTGNTHSLAQFLEAQTGAEPDLTGAPTASQSPDIPEFEQFVGAQRHGSMVTFG